MTDEFNQRVPTNVLVRLSDYFRKNVDKLEKNKRIYKRAYSTSSYFIYSTLPIVLSSSIMYPLLRLKLIIQTDSMRVDKVHNVKNAFYKVKEIGIKSIFKGNLSLNTFILVQGISKFMFYDRIKAFYNRTIFVETKSESKLMIRNAISSLTAGLLTAILSYPYDLALARIGSSITTNYSNRSNVFQKEKYSGIFGFLSKYDGIKYGLLEGTINAFCVLFLYNSLIQFNNFKTSTTKDLFILSSVIGTLSSVITYPFNSLKRHIQVSGLNSEFKTENISIKNLIDNPKLYYSGISLHIIRSVPMIFIQLSLVNLLKKNLSNN